MTSYSGYCSVLMEQDGSKVGFYIDDFLVNKPNISGTGADQGGAFQLQTPAGGCLPGVFQGKPAASHLAWIRHGTYADFMFEGPTKLSNGILTHTGAWFNHKTPSITGTFFLRSVPPPTDEQKEAEYNKPYDAYLISCANDVHDFATGVSIDLQKRGFRIFQENPASPVNKKREQKILADSKTVIVILSDSLFADAESVAELTKAIELKKPLVLIRYAGALFGSENYPSAAFLPEKLRATFTAEKGNVLEHKPKEFDKLIGDVKSKLGSPSGNAWA